MYGMILLGLVVLVLGISIALAALRGFSKSGIRFLTVLISAVGAVVTCLIVKANLPNPEEFLQKNINASGELGSLIDQLMAYGEISPTLIELVIQLAGALILPILCLILFCLYSLVTLLVYVILKKVLALPLKGLDHAVPMSRLWGILFGLVQGIVVSAIILLPISGYLSVAEPTVDGLVEQEVVDANDSTTQTLQSVIEEMDQSPVVTVYRTVGGRLLTDSIMKMEVADMEVKIEEELDSVLGLVARISDLGKTELADYSMEEAEMIRDIAVSFDDSKLLAPIAGDILYAATDAWMNGESFLGVEKPSMGEATELFEPFTDALFEILHDDAKTADLLRADIHTLADVIATLVQYDVIANFNNTDALLTTLGGEGVVKSLINTLGANDSMKRLVPEVTNLGVRAIGQVLKVPEDVDALYGDFMEDVAGALNEVSLLPENQQIEVLSQRLETAFDEAGVPIDAEILDVYSAGMVHDLVENNPDNEVTSADVQAFFALYSERVVEDGPTVSANYPGILLLGSTDSEDPFAGTVYENMTEEERSRTATAMLAELCTELSKLNAEDENFSEQAKNLVVGCFTQVLGEEHAALETLKNTEITQPVSADSIQNTASLKSSDALKETTTVITLKDLLVDGKTIAETITGESIQLEAETIEVIFNAAGDLLDKLNNGDGSQPDMTELSDSLGTILDSLNQTGSFGEEKTAALFTAVLQSESVRESAGMDMKTATEMAAQATEGEGSYAQTMGTVANSVSIVDQLNKDGKITDGELVELIQNLTPRTAGMVCVYINSDRMVGFGVPKQYADTSAALVSSAFTYMSREDLKDYDAESKGLNQVLQIALAAKDSGNQKLFSSAAGVEDGQLPTAKETVESMMGSEAVRFALVDVLTDGQSVTAFDSMGLGERLERDEQNKIDLQNAISEYRAAHPEVSDLTYEALAALFSLEMNF